MLFFILSTIGKFLTKDEERDRTIMARIKARDAAALTELYDHYHRLLFGLILTILKKREEAEDTLQEVFTKIWEKAEQFDLERGTVYTWIVSLTRNKSIDRLCSKVYKEQKKVIQVAYFNGMTQSEISEEYNIPLGTVKTRMRDGMIKLRELLAKGVEL